MRVAVLFDGAGLARRGLEYAGHECVGFELDEWKCHLADLWCDGESHWGDARDFDISNFDAVWASPPCQKISTANWSNNHSKQMNDLLKWSLYLPHKVLWVENVTSGNNTWGTIYNAAQFTPTPLQNRNRVIGGRYLPPKVYHAYRRWYPEAMPCILACEGRGGLKKRAGRALGRQLSLEEAAFYQGIDTLPESWLDVPSSWPGTPTAWRNNLFEAIGNGVPVYMAEAFGNRYSEKD